MKVVIVGLPQAGQQHLFSLLAGLSMEQVGQRAFEVQPGSVSVRDQRIDKLSSIFNPKKTIFAKIDFLLLPDFQLQGPAKTTIFNELKNSDEICWVSRLDTAEKDIANFISELIIFDLMLIEKRLENIEKEKKHKKVEGREKEEELLSICKIELEKEKPLRELVFNEEQQKALRTYQFLTLKPIVLVINVPEDKISDNKIAAKFNFPAITLSAELEE